MVFSPLHVLVLYDLPEITDGHADPTYLLNHPDRPTERDVCKTIKKLGMKLSVFGVYDQLESIPETVHRIKPDVVFNLCETFLGDRMHEGHIAGVLQLIGVPITGATAEALQICKDKAIAKKIVRYDGIRVPSFKVIQRGELLDQDLKEYPLIVKPLNREASEGIAQASIVRNLESALERINFIHEKLESDVIVEEFIQGRELYVGVLETENTLKVLPPRELFIKELKDDQMLIATYKAKWDDIYRKKWGIETGKAKALSSETLQDLVEGSKQAFKTLRMSGYARIDWRVNSNGEPIFLEANPNPALSIDDDFAKAAKTAGIGYQELISEIIGAAMAKGFKKLKAAS